MFLKYLLLQPLNGNFFIRKMSNKTMPKNFSHMQIWIFAKQDEQWSWHARKRNTMELQVKQVTHILAYLQNKVSFCGSKIYANESRLE